MTSAKLPIDAARFAQPPASPLVEATLDLVKQAVRRRLVESGMGWANSLWAGPTAS